MDCPDVETLLRFAGGRMPAAERVPIEDHLDRCDDCRSVLAAGAKFLFGEAASPGSDKPTSPLAGLAPGTNVGRFEIVAVLGAGAAGVVYRAYDPQLDRPVALKLMAPVDPSSASAADEGGDRLLREARAMARLAHPNVVNVHDAGTYQGQVFVVMELVEGRTLGEWLREGRRSWREIVDVFAEAGRGLAAAHGAGLVHRDFKPDNVLVGKDDRARVTDFGLARAVRSTSASAETGVRVFVGTPAYMAPEQFLARDTDARTDQFSFCVALYGALYDQQPFADHPLATSPIAALAGEVVAGRLRPAPAGAGVPSWLFEVLAHGLAADPARRYPSMDDLLVDLARRLVADGRPRISRRARAVGLGLGVAAAAAAVVAWRMAAMPPAIRCGNGRVEAGEECDDGNRDSDDGCTASCLACRAGPTTFVWPPSGHCYGRHDEGMSWPDAEAACEQGGGTLVTYTSTYESRAVGATLLRGLETAGWIGIARTTENPLFWISGEVMALATPWAKGEPKAGCVYATPNAEVRDPSSRSFGSDWGTAPCERPLPFVCEKGGWSPREQSGHLYRFVPSPQGFDPAAAACARAGGHLVTITGADEQAFVAALADVGFWIGSTDRKKTGQYAWVTGEPAAFKEFAAGEPDSNMSTSCILLGRDDLWHDRDCAAPHPFVCEID